MKNNFVSFYDFMSALDKFTIEKAEEYDFRDLSVHCNRIMDVEFLYLKDKAGDIVLVWILGDEKL